MLSALVIFLMDALYCSLSKILQAEIVCATCHFAFAVHFDTLFFFFQSGYVQSSDPADNWKDKGTGQLSIRCKEGVSKGTKESKPTVIVRNDVCFPSRHLWFQILKLV